MTRHIVWLLLLPIATLGCFSTYTDQVNTANNPSLSQVASTKVEDKPSPVSSPRSVSQSNSQSNSQRNLTQTTALSFRGVDTFTIDELMAVNSGGCGMSLQAKSAKGTRNFLFFNGISPNSMVMKINGKMTRFSLVEAMGNEFYGQKNFQTFISEDKKIEVRVAVIQGKIGKIESIDISTGVMLIKTTDSFQELEVTGDAGC